MLGLNSIEQIVLATISSGELEKYRNEVKSRSASEGDQRLDRTREHKNDVYTQRHTDDNPHTDYGGHYDRSPHRDTGGHTNQSDHSNTPHSNSTGPHTNYIDHINTSGEHTNMTDQKCHSRRPNGVCEDWSNYHKNRDGHLNTRDAHANRARHYNTPGHSNNRHTNENNHKDGPDHNNHNDHTNRRPHTNTHTDRIDHSNTGFDHDNYIPSRPHFRVLGHDGELESVHQGLMIRDVTTIAFYSYDKNIDGHGSQDSVSRTVRYTLRMRKVKDDDGRSDVGNWITLVNNSTNYIYDLNTKLYDEGYYELECTAKNNSISGKGVTKNYVSYTQKVQVRIKQNQDPIITVNNGGDFINFYFGHRGGYKGEEFRYYDVDDEGILIEISMRDPDDKVKQWQKGTIHLERPGGGEIPGTRNDIVWENGSTVISSQNTTKRGYVFIPKDNYLVDNMEGVRVVIMVRDFLDEGCNIPAGATVIQDRVNRNRGDLLRFNVDRTYPGGTITGNPTTWTNQDVVLRLTGNDPQGLGVRRIQLPDGSWVRATSVNSKPISINGLYEFMVEDMAGNQTKIPVVVDKIDQANPTIWVDDVQITQESSVDEYHRKVNSSVGVYVTIKVEDLPLPENPTGISGIKEIRYAITQDIEKPTSGWQTIDPSVAELTVHIDRVGDNYVHVEAWDYAGNYEYGYKGNYRINSEIELGDLKITDDDPGIRVFEGSRKLNIRGYDAYVVLKNAFRNMYNIGVVNDDFDDVKLYYTITNVYDPTGTPVYEGSSVISKSARYHNFILNYHIQIGDKLENFEDGLYKVKVRGVDYEDDMNPDEGDFYSEDTKEVYIIIKKDAPPRPVISYDEDSKEVTIVYPPEENELFNEPVITQYYEKEYQLYDGLIPYEGNIKIDKNSTIHAIYTDIAGNTSQSVMNISLGGDRPGSGSGDYPEDLVDAKVEESRTAKRYFINIRRNPDGGVNKNKLKFVRKLNR